MEEHSKRKNIKINEGRHSSERTEREREEERKDRGRGERGGGVG